MRSLTSPFWNRRTVPLDSLIAIAIAIAIALVAQLMAAAAQWRAPRPLLRVMSTAGAETRQPRFRPTHNDTVPEITASGCIAVISVKRVKSRTLKVSR